MIRFQIFVKAAFKKLFYHNTTEKSEVKRRRFFAKKDCFTLKTVLFICREIWYTQNEEGCYEDFEFRVGKP